MEQQNQQQQQMICFWKWFQIEICTNKRKKILDFPKNGKAFVVLVLVVVQQNIVVENIEDIPYSKSFTEKEEKEQRHEQEPHEEKGGGEKSEFIDRAHLFVSKLSGQDEAYSLFNNLTNKNKNKNNNSSSSNNNNNNHNNNHNNNNKQKASLESHQQQEQNHVAQN